ncbi:hypothetical protein [Tuwongella immobilis]|uniref:Uncharacterized protein n=1 Tax=Tuwongella immobilis TaxID=692036 RepID=A0A6C2YU86_9BACT|nr:hypothetical protein [Tuwongella immobilis]VIP04994.1 Putative uncharacterized protein OS=Rhodopirellula baltica (strain SH1) GN=RB4360 PE=4 SV=1 [Tuwongella immobilis]VTS07346.1 Putative uncharacterized protein OS=Rhodopirellula baltica (strain SH1) GN=RB4360 PE=4 SV=1 [Tuwongella immobilis]
MGKLEGTIALTGVPPHRGLMVSLSFFPVNSPDDPVPYDGDPPPEIARDSHSVHHQVDLSRESSQSEYEFPIEVERPDGFYYLELRAVLLRTHDGQLVAQAEPFFFARRPMLFCDPPLGKITLPIPWPAVAVDELPIDGVIEPQ